MRSQEEDKLVTSFLMSARNNQPDLLMIEASAVLQLSDSKSVLNDALVKAIRANGYRSTILILELGADPNKANPLLPITEACIIGNKQIAAALIEFGSKLQGERAKSISGPLIQAIRKGNSEIVDLFIRKKIKLDKGQEQFAVHIACQHDHVVILKMLIEAGAKLTYEKNPRDYPLGSDIFTPFSQCVRSESIDCIQFLYSIGEKACEHDLKRCGEKGCIDILKAIQKQQKVDLCHVLEGLTSNFRTFETHYNGRIRMANYIFDYCGYTPDQHAVNNTISSLVLNLDSDERLLKFISEKGYSISSELSKEIVEEIENRSRYSAKEKRQRYARLDICNIEQSNASS